MTDPNLLTPKYLAEGRIMQIATIRNGQPWICTVYFVVDDDWNFYWLSLPTRRHSEDIAINSQIAVAVAIKFDQPIIGLQFEGHAAAVADREVVKHVLPKYVDKYGQGRDFYDNFVAGKSQHLLYRFTPNRGQLFDELNFPGGVGQELEIPKTS